ncbi:hypothetical protein BV337_05658 [Pseudomonas syringae pv. actinidiae]|nr:hypothetical protein BV337_05658 [Pseudomonas syringae pv. actinidiae]
MPPILRPLKDLISRHSRPKFVDHIVRFDAHCFTNDFFGVTGVSERHLHTRLSLDHVGAKVVFDFSFTCRVESTPPSLDFLFTL